MSAAAARRLLARFDRLGVVVGTLAAYAAVVEPFVSYRPNRIAAGVGHSLATALPSAAALVAFVLAAGFVATALVRVSPVLRLTVAALAVTGHALLLGLAADHLTAPAVPYARIAPAAGFWLGLLAYTLAAVDALIRLHFGPLRRLAALAVLLAGLAVLLAAGWWNELSLLKEYASRADSFMLEAQRHVLLAGGSLAIATLIGLPLGLACHRLGRLRAVTLPVLNIVQTIPSIALFALLMPPLALLVAAAPALAALGMRGIGAAPALIALVLYALLPVVANTVAGLAAAPRHVVEAARGMGMTDRQRLLRVELPLALPAVLSGIRIALVQNIGLVTVAALIGGGGFGSFVFQGIGQTAVDLVLLGTVPTIALALVAAILLDAVIALARRTPA